MSEAIPLSGQEHALLVQLRRRYATGIPRRRGWTLAAMSAEYEMFRALAERRRATDVGNGRREWPEDERMLTEFYWVVADERAKVERMVRADCPIGWFKPSWEQAEALNSWHPDYDQDAPEGYKNTCNFGGKRALKTTATVIHNLLWMIPNDPQWVMFEPYTDHIGRRVQVFPRFNWDEWSRSGRRIFDNSAPPKSECLLWHGMPNENHWKGKLEPEYRKWMPDKFIARKGKDREWYVSDRRFRAKHGTFLSCKLYDSDVQDWSGAEMFCISLDEGVPRDKLSEAIYRTRYIQWAYTPAEAANIGQKAALAKAVYDGRFKMPGKTKFLFPKTSNTPDFAIDRKLIEERVALAAQRGEEGRVEVEGGFFNSSPVVFKHFKRELHVLPMDGNEALKKWPDAVKIRGFDEGFAHLTACVWIMILRTGEYVAYRDFGEANLSVTERCEKIIELSRNERVVTHEHYDPDRVRYKEQMSGEVIRRTFADSKIFRRNPETVQDDWVDSYRKKGLILERATNIGPAKRCDDTNDMFLPDHTRKHLIDREQVGFKLYVTNDCTQLIERLENYLQEQYKSGDRAGQFTGNPEKTGDDVIDAFCYACASKLRWIDSTAIHAAPQKREAVSVSSVTGY